MKKRLLITSIVMMLVVAVALSTATYAWFTSNAGVTASSVQLTAASNAGASIGIAWENDALGSAITAKAATGTWSPMAPATLTEGTTQSNVAFETATIRNNNNAYVFNGPDSANPFVYESATNQTYFRVANTSTSNAASVQLTLKDIGGNTAASDTNNLLRVGVFTCATATGTYTLAKVLAVAADQEVAFGDLVQDAAVESLVSSGNEYTAATSYTFTLAAGTTSVLYFKVIAWMDGYALNDATASSTATFGLDFVATKA